MCEMIATKTPERKNHDIGSLLNTVSHLLTDVRFITRIDRSLLKTKSQIVYRKK